MEVEEGLCFLLVNNPTLSKCFLSLCLPFHSGGIYTSPNNKRKPSGVLALWTCTQSFMGFCRPEIKFSSYIAAESVDLFIGICLGFYPIMASVRRFSRFAAVASAAVTFSGAYIIFNSSRNPARASADTSPGFQSYPEEFADRLLYKPSGLRWDPNWDMCDRGEKKPKRKDNGRFEEESREIKPTAVRHLVFIRHGQYNEGAANDDDKRLTELGRYGRKKCFVCYIVKIIFSFDFLSNKKMIKVSEL